MVSTSKNSGSAHFHVSWLSDFIFYQKPSSNNKTLNARLLATLPCYLQGSENGRVVTIGKHSRLNRQIWYRHPNSEAGNDEIQNFQREFS
jgi:hypothetical protein